MGGHDLHGPIGLDQEPAFAGQGSKGLLALQFGVGTHGCGPLGHQGIAALDEAGAPGGGEALFQGFELAHHGVEQGAPVVE